MKRLNLGSGKDFKKGFINIDFEDFSNLGENFMRLDLEKPLPFKDNSVDEVYSESCLEHLFNLYQILDEIHRICRPDAKITFIVPHFTNNTYEFHIRPFRFDMLHDYCVPDEKFTSSKTHHKYWFDRKYFYKVKRRITFKSIYSFMNLINIHPVLVKMYEFTFLRSFFFAHSVIFEAKIHKRESK